MEKEFNLSKRIREGHSEEDFKFYFIELNDVKEFIKRLKEVINNKNRVWDNMRISRDYLIIEIDKLAGSRFYNNAKKILYGDL